MKNIPKVEPKQETLIDKGEGEEYHQELFNYLHDLGVIALESELQEIERMVLKMQQDKNKYSKEEVLAMLLIKHDGLSPEYVLEQFKNK